MGTVAEIAVTGRLEHFGYSGAHVMTELYCLEQRAADLPTAKNWLSRDEVVCLDRLRFEKRRSDWLLGRWTAKRAVALSLGLRELPADLSQVEIRAEPSGAPAVFLLNRLADPRQKATISLSHSCGRAVCVVVLREVALGCDIEKADPRSDAFVADYFTAEEQVTIARSAPKARARISTLIWSAKESALKALHTGLRADTRSVSVTVTNRPENSPGWSPLQVLCAKGQTLRGWWRETEGFVLTIVSDSALIDQPALLEISGHHS